MFDWVTGFIESVGYVGIALLMFAENVFPPIPSELIMPLAGFNSANGEMNIVIAIIAGCIGSLAGAVFWYYIGAWIGTDRLKHFARRHGRLLTLTPGEVDQADRWFDRHGGKAVFLGRLVPAVRTLISVPAGISGMHLGPFLLYSTLGTVIWTTFLALCGYWLGSQYEKVQTWIDPVSKAVVAAIVLWYLYRVVTFRRKVAREDA